MPSETVLLSMGAVTAALLVWAVAQLVGKLFPSRRQRVEERLSLGGRPDTQSAIVAVLKQGPSSTLSGRSGTLGRFERRLQLVHPTATLPRFAAMCFGIATLSAAIVYRAVGPALAAIIGVVAGLAPLFIYSIERGRRERVMSDQLVEALDFLARILRAGHSFATGLKMCGEELPNPIAAEFTRCHDQHMLGQPMEQALVQMADRIDLTDFNFFVTSVSIQRQTGGDLSEILDNIARMIRARIQLNQQVKALTSEGRATGAILTALPVLIFLVMWSLNPKYTGVLLYTDTGRTVIAVTVVLMIVGILMIRKIVTIKV